MAIYPFFFLRFLSPLDLTTFSDGGNIKSDSGSFFPWIHNWKRLLRPHSGINQSRRRPHVDIDSSLTSFFYFQAYLHTLAEEKERNINAYMPSGCRVWIEKWWFGYNVLHVGGGGEKSPFGNLRGFCMGSQCITLLIPTLAQDLSPSLSFCREMP